MFLSVPPHHALRPYVQGYWFIEDLPGRYQGRPIQTGAHPGAVLTVNMGHPNATEDGAWVPRVSLLGPQTRARGWRSCAETSFVMVMMTVRGLARVAPGAGAACCDTLVDLGAIVGDPLTRSLAGDLDVTWRPPEVAARLDRWLARRIEAVPAPPELSRLCAARELLRAGHPVSAVATRIGVSRRQLCRWFHRHTGIGPKQLADLDRLQASLGAVQHRRGDPLAGYSDQAHQIRGWRRRLLVTPGAYARGSLSPMASYFGSSAADAPAFYL